MPDPACGQARAPAYPSGYARGRGTSFRARAKPATPRPCSIETLLSVAQLPSARVDPVFGPQPSRRSDTLTFSQREEPLVAQRAGEQLYAPSSARKPKLSEAQSCARRYYGLSPAPTAAADDAPALQHLLRRQRPATRGPAAADANDRDDAPAPAQRRPRRFNRSVGGGAPPIAAGPKTVVVRGEHTTQ